jgi:hypothetical protein
MGVKMLTQKSFADSTADQIKAAGLKVCMGGNPEDFDELLAVSIRAGSMKWQPGKHIAVANALSNVLRQIQRKGRGERIRILIKKLDAQYRRIVIFGELVN